MQEPERPLGLGILAVVSFAAGLWNLQSSVMLVILVAGKMNMPEQPAMAAAYYALPPWFRVFLLGSAFFKAALLFGAGLCYFARRRLGRLLGSSYAVLSLVESALAVAVFGVFGRDSVIGVLFAVFTLISVNTMFRRYLTR